MPNTILTVKDIRITKKQEVIGIIFALITVLIWSSYALSLRLAALSPLNINRIDIFSLCNTWIFIITYIYKKF